MRLALVGPEIEENLALRYIDAAARKAGHVPEVFDFSSAAQSQQVVEAILRFGPDVVGLSLMYTRRSREFVALARELRARGFAGHLTCGGHFAVVHSNELLREVEAIDSVLLGEGEEVLVELLANLQRPERVAGMVRRTTDGGLTSTPARPPPDDLDVRAWPTRPPKLDQMLGLKLANVVSGRGCWASCRFCSINAWHGRIGGLRFRQRAVEALADEMAALYSVRGVHIFNFHDDNFFHPRREVNLDRFTRLKALLDERGVGPVGIQVKARPDSVDPEVIASLKALGLFRVFLGVESNAVNGLKALGRGISREQNHRALQVLLDAGVHVSFNLLMFEPDCTLSDLRENVFFMRRWAEVPLNYCRVEVYGGTALERDLRAQGRLTGDCFGYSYAIADPAAQTAYEIFHAALAPRAFALDGANALAMALDYHLHLLERFWPERVHASLRRRVHEAVRAVNEDSARLLMRVCDFAEGRPDAAAVEEFSRRLAAEREEFDRRACPRAARLIAEMGGLARMPRLLAEVGGTFAKVAWLFAAIVLAAALVITFFGQNLRALFAASTELSGEEAPRSTPPPPAPAPPLAPPP